MESDKVLTGHHWNRQTKIIFPFSSSCFWKKHALVVSVNKNNLPVTEMTKIQPKFLSSPPATKLGFINCGVHGDWDISSLQQRQIQMEEMSESQSKTIFAVAAISTVFASLCSATIVIVAYVLMKNPKIKGKGVMILIDNMNRFQFLFDITFFTSMMKFGNASLQSASIFLNVFGGCRVNWCLTHSNFAMSLGIGSTLVSNYIAALAFYSIKNRNQKFNMHDIHWKILIPTSGFCGVVSVLTLFPITDLAAHNIYYYTCIGYVPLTDWSLYLLSNRHFGQDQ